MARLALGLAGAAVGSLVGLPGLGFAIGSALGGALFPGEGATQEGPRLNDLSVTSSAYGQAIPIAYGSNRMGGNMIWSAGIREERNKRSQGGKGGGPKQTQITYTYYSSFAIAFSEGVAKDVVRIWADSNLIFDKSSTDNIEKPGLNFRFYPGDEDQLPDPLIEADVGDGQAPAHRGLCYVVFEDLELTDFGNRIPNITAEIAFETESTNSIQFSEDIDTFTGSFTLGNMAVDLRRRRVYLLRESTDADLEPAVIRIFNMDTLQEVKQVQMPKFNDHPTVPYATTGFAVGEYSGDLYFRGQANTEPLVRIDPNSGEITGTAEVDTILGFFMGQAVEVNTSDGKYVVGTRIGGFGGDNKLDIAAVDVTPTTIGGAGSSGMIVVGEDVHPSVITKPISGIIAQPHLTQDGIVWVGSHNGDNTDIEIYQLQIRFWAGQLAVNLADGLFLEEAWESATTLKLSGAIDSSNWDDNGGNSGGAVTSVSIGLMGPIYDETDNTLIFIKDKATGAGTYVIKWDPDTGVQWVTETTTGIPGNGIIQWQNSAKLKTPYLGYLSPNEEACLIDTRTGELLLDRFDVQAELSIDFQTISCTQFFDGPTQSIFSENRDADEGDIAQIFLNRVSTQGATVDSIVSDISERAGLTPASDIDVSELTSDTVKGYVISRQMSARDAIQPLSTAFFFDGVESDDKIVFKKRGRSVTRTIDSDDLIELDEDTADVVKETRTQEVELPERLSVTYSDVNLNYQQGTASAKRIREPFPTIQTRNEQNVALPMVLTASEAAQIAEKLLYTVWSERTSHTWRAPWTHLDLDPADVVDLTIGPTTLRARIAKSTINLDFTMSMESITENSVTVISDSDSSGGLGLPQRVPFGPLFTELFLLDIPLLRDIDDTSRNSTRLYFTMNGYTDDWQGGTLWDSDGESGVTFDNTGLRVFDGAVHGTVFGKLPDTELPFQTDYDTELEVYLPVGELSSVTQLEFLNNTNTALIGNPLTQNWEVIAFKDAVQQPGGTYVISTILRGRRGTEKQVGTHGLAETFILLDADTMASIRLDLGDVGTTRAYKGVSFGDIVENAELKTLASSGADLKPYAPAHLDAVVDGSSNIDIEWVRRTRIGGSLVDNVGEVPLSEDTEAYEVDIKDGPDGTVLRTLTSTENSVQYDNADIVTDFGSVPAAVTFEVFQMSAQVGRGFGTEETVTL